VIEKSGFDSKAGLQPAPFWLVFPLEIPAGKVPARTNRPRARSKSPLALHRGAQQRHPPGQRQSLSNSTTPTSAKCPTALPTGLFIGNGTYLRRRGNQKFGSRWTRQINGGHVHSDYLNNIALGICLIGDFDQEKPTRTARLPSTSSPVPASARR
jgi:hypothetical protein